MPPIHPYFKNIRQLIGDGQMEEAIRQLKVLLANSPKLNEALLHSGRWNDVLQQIRKGTVTHEDANVTKNQIREALLQFIQEIENQQQEPTLRQELSNAISIAQSKNVSRGSIKAGGHVRIGDENHYHYYGKKKILHALTPDPFLPEAFLGRTKELSEIHRRLRTDHHFLLLVNGEGGVGKTSLAAKYYFQYHHEYQHVAWLLSEKSIANALLRLDRSLGIKFPPTMRSPEKLKILFTEMASLKAPCLLVLDNANEINDLDEHYLKLRGIHNFHILLTTRITRYSQADTYPIRGLPKDDALELFEKYYRPLSPEEYDLFTQIRTAVNDNTLVLEVLAKNLRQLNRLRDRYTLADLLGDLQKKNLLQLAQSKSVTATYQSRGALRREKPENIIAAMYDLTELPREEVALLSMFAVLPADAIPFEKLEMLLPEELELEDPLLSLSQRGWIEHNEDDATFKCSPVVQEVTRRKNEQLRKDCQPLIDGLNKKLDYEPGVGHFKNATYENALVFAGYAESVVNIDKADFDLAMLSERIGGCFRTTGNLEKALFFFEKEKKLFANLLEINPENSTFKNGLAVSYSKLGDTHSSLGHLEKALQYFEERSRLGKELYEKYP
ncbi:MAG: NB-ARC domain-containing protein, partial [Bacteroidota bacterium]